MENTLPTWSDFVLSIQDIFQMMWDSTPDFWYFCTHTLAESSVYFGLDDQIFGLFSHMHFTPLEAIMGGAMVSCLFVILRKFFSIFGI